MVTTDAGRSVQIEPGPGWQKRGLQGSVRLEREVATRRLTGLVFLPKLKCDLPYLSYSLFSSRLSPPTPPTSTKGTCLCPAVSDIYTQVSRLLSFP